MSENRWMYGIGIGLLVVVLVNAAFLTIAVQNAPVVTPSYTNDQDR